MAAGETGLFGLNEGVPFEPIDVPAKWEQGIQFVGTYGDCETVAEDWLPGSGLVVGQAFAPVRGGVLTTDVEIPLPSSLALSAPTSCP